jgi:hypothetical protein
MWPFGTRAPIVPLCWSQRRHRAGPPAAWRVETDGGGVGHAARSAFARLTREAPLNWPLRWCDAVNVPGNASWSVSTSGSESPPPRLGSRSVRGAPAFSLALERRPSGSEAIRGIRARRATRTGAADASGVDWSGERSAANLATQHATDASRPAPCCEVQKHPAEGSWYVRELMSARSHCALTLQLSNSPTRRLACPACPTVTPSAETPPAAQSRSKT